MNDSTMGAEAHDPGYCLAKWLRHGRPCSPGRANSWGWRPSGSPNRYRLFITGEGVWESQGVGLLAETLGGQIRSDCCLELRVPDHEAALEILHMAPWPVALSSEGSPSLTAMRSAEAVMQAAGPEIDLLIDDGLSFFDQPATEVAVKGEEWTIGREGVLTSNLIAEQAACRIVFVCTGNTCRSPLAEALCKKRLADRLGCSEAELPNRGFVVLSAGLAAMMGEEAATEAWQAAQFDGAKLRKHAGRQATADVA